MSSPNTSLPNWGVPLIDPQTGVTSQAWFSFFAGLAGQPGPIVSVNPQGNPFTYKASANGYLAISGGRVNDVSLTRARVAGVPLGITSGIVPLSQGDVVTISYSIPPEINFIPS